jgi:uncharacterized protein YecE (DUF72 family)
MPVSGITSGMTATSPSVTGLYVGASGFSYPSWTPAFYPAGTGASEFLRLYSARLPSVELNNTGYKLPSEASFRKWAEQTPPGFRFAVKMSRQITHGGRLELVGTFCERVRLLGDRLGPILVGFPDERPRDDGMLRLLLDSLDPELAYAFDFRHPSWDEVDAPIVRVGALEAEQPFRYLRLREPPYDDVALAGWAQRIAPLLAEGLDVHVYFKHEDEPTAPQYAERLRELVIARGRS